MATVSDVVAAIQALGTKLGGSATTMVASPVSGTFALEGSVPVVTLAAVVDPKDLIRVSAVVTVDVSIRQEPTMVLMNNEGIPDRRAGDISNTVVRRVYTIDAVGGVNANGRKVGLPPLPVPVATTSTNSPDMPRGILDVATCTLVSSTLQLLTRYHYG